MIAPPRRVGHLRLRAPDAGALRRGRFLVEDALRTASIPEATAGRLLVIRHLALGPIDPRATPTSIALRIERCVRLLAAAAVPWHHPDAERADAVVFADRIAAFEALAIHVARGRAPSAWYWRAAMPDPRPANAPAILRALLARALDTPEGPAAVARIVDAARAAGVLDPVLAAIEPVDGPALLRAFGLPPAPIRPAPWSPPTDAPRPASAWTAPLDRWRARWHPADPRLRWLVAVALLAERPELSRSPALAPLVEPVIAALAHAALDPPAEPAPEAPPAIEPDAPAEPQPTPADPIAPPGPPDPRPAAAEAPPDAAPPPTSAPTAPAPITPPTAPARAERPAPPEAPPRPRATAFAGLYFLLPILARLGLPESLDDRPDLAARQLPARILDHVATHLGAPPDDPIRLPVAPIDPPPACPFEAPPRWTAIADDRPRRLAPRLGDPAAAVEVDPDGMPWALRRPAPAPLEGPPAGAATDLDTLCLAWRHALARALAAIDPALTLAAVVARPGAVLHTRTGVDVIFDLADADLAIRRPALDVDPGWLPWLGRVVHYHYLVGGRRAGD